MRGCVSWGRAAGALALLTAGLIGTASARPADPPEQVWQGKLKLPNGAELRIIFHVVGAGGANPTATLDSPDQGAKGLKVDAVTLGKDSIAFEMKTFGARYEGKLNKAGTEAVGDWSQGGGSLALTLVKSDKVSKEGTIVGKEQLWEGKIGLGNGLSLRVAVHVGKDPAGKTVATFDSLDQGAKGLKVDSVSIDKATFRFEMKSIGGKFEGKLNKEGTEAVGEWEQGGNKLPLTLKTTDKVSELKRPQTPKAPFPYRSEDVAYPNKAAGLSLAGTLTLPTGEGPFPAVVMITGSGAQDRDETLFEHKPFLVIADTLTRRGVAVLRVDDRGVGGSTGSASKATSEDFAGDVQAGIDYLKTRKEIDAKRIGLIGHSEGGVIAPMVAAKSSDVAFIVLLAGTGLPGDEILQLQARLIGETMVQKDEKKALEVQLEAQRRLIEVVKSEPDDKKAAEQMKAVVEDLKKSLSDDEKKALGKMESAIDGELKTLRSAWFRYFFRHDPRPTLAKVRCPVLAVVGEKDLQVPPKQNLREIAKALKDNKDVTVRELPGLNHLFQRCKTGSPAEYASLEETIAPEALQAVGDWVVAHTKSR